MSSSVSVGSGARQAGSLGDDDMIGGESHRARPTARAGSPAAIQQGRLPQQEQGLSIKHFPVQPIEPVAKPPHVQWTPLHGFPRFGGSLTEQVPAHVIVPPHEPQLVP
jgi:hypothetical protein